MQQILLLILLIVLLGLFVKTQKNEVLMVKSSVDGNEYLVRNLPDRQDVADLLATIKKKIFTLKDYLVQNINKYPNFEEYIKLLDRRINNVIIKEKTENNNFTSYSVNKGEEIIFCVRSKNNDKIHDLNLIMYVVLHEISHVACPEIGHTPLFKKIFKFFLETAILLKMYQYTDYSHQIKEYCGIYINESIL